MKVNEIKGYESVRDGYEIIDGVLHYNGQAMNKNVVRTVDGLAIEFEATQGATEVEVLRDGRVFYTLKNDPDEIAKYLRLPKAKFNKIYKDGLYYMGYTFKFKGVEHGKES